MQEICPREKCTGCAACYNVCPKNCIQMKENEYGEVQPFIVEKECIDCGSCHRVCPNVDEKYKSLLNPKAEVCYAAARKDLQKQPRVASGGIATFLMEKAFQAGWKVFGTALDQKMKIEVKELKSLDELEMFQGSRYVQSNVGDSFKKIKEAVKQGKTLFIGTPCQVAGMRALCGKNVENLYTCDLVCHGVNPQSYLWEELEWKNKDKNNLTNITFRGVSSTEDYWLCLWKNETKEYAAPRGKNEFLTGFYSGFSLRASCHTCNYPRKERVGDLTLGDFLGLEHETSLLKKNLCTLMIPNNTKGNDLMQFLDDSIVIEMHPAEEAFAGGISFQKAFEWNETSRGFREVYKRDGYVVAMKKYGTPHVVRYKLETIPRVLKRVLKR